jgi:hypothetical protein
MDRVALKGCALEIAFVVPNNHHLVGAGFPLYDDVVVHKDRGVTTTVGIDENIADVTVAELCAKLVKDDGRAISWIAMKPGVRNSRIYIFFSQDKKSVKMSPAVKRAVDKLIAQTWAWGKYYVLRNSKGLDLINIEVVKPQGKKPALHFFGIEAGNVLAFEAESSEPADQKSTEPQSIAR